MVSLSPRRRVILRWITPFISIMATVQIVRFHMASLPGVEMDSYLRGTEPLPFQKRYLPALLIRGMLHLGPVVRFCLAHSGMMSPPSRFCEMLISILALLVAGYFCQRLYRSTTSNGRLDFLIYPILLALVLVTYTVHAEHNLNLPYDFPSVAFFSAGLYFIYTRQFWPLFFVILVGTVNRETTLFLVPIYLLDLSSKAGADPALPFWQSFNLRQVAWLRTCLLFLGWAAVEYTLSRTFAHNDRSQTYLRARENIDRLRHPGFIPNIMNICSYLLPIIVVAAPAIRPVRFGNYVLVALPWVVVMFFYGILLETRIYGELLPYVTIVSVLLIEQVACAVGASPAMRAGFELQGQPLPGRPAE